jgi:hypothetical protein
VWGPSFFAAFITKNLKQSSNELKCRFSNGPTEAEPGDLAPGDLIFDAYLWYVDPSCESMYKFVGADACCVGAKARYLQLIFEHSEQARAPHTNGPRGGCCVVDSVGDPKGI